MDAGAVALLVVCLQEPDVALKRACALSLAEISAHSAEVRGCADDAARVMRCVAAA